MRRKHSKLRMGFRGRSGFLTSAGLGIAVLVMIYYGWSRYMGSSSRISYSSVQGLEPGQMEQWDKQRQPGFVIDDPTMGHNKEIELQMANEMWKKAKALQDHIDEDRIAQEQAARARGKSVDSILQDQANHQHQAEGQAGREQSLLFRQADPLDGDYFSRLERVVHLDLKGAPFLVSYLEQLFPLLRSMGATGLLLEYEDMFPYSGNLSLLASASAYSLSDLQRIQAAAKLSQLEIIPLVQTFGHMEFVLKHAAFRGLREQDYTPQVISPVKEGSYTLIFNMLDQVLKAHPESRRIHLGCDEVYELGKGESRSYLIRKSMNPGGLFLQHVVRVAKHLKASVPSVRALIWDDWLRRIPYEDLANSELGSYVEPVVWYYQHDISNRVPAEKWTDYSSLFPGVWVASAFKGATGSSQLLTNASVHLDNNLQWVGIMRQYGVHNKKIQFRGVVLTGWQRYDHFATLCELLPVGLPSLALSLQAVKNGAFGDNEWEAAGRVLKCQQPPDLGFPAVGSDGSPVRRDCRFPGSEVLYGVQKLWGIMEVYHKDVGLQERITGWMTDFHVRKGISSPGQMKILAHKLERVLLKLQELTKPMQDRLLNIYDKWTIDEWIATNIQDRSSHIRDLYKKARTLLAMKEWPGRPFPEMTTKAPAQLIGQAPAVQGAPQAGPRNLPQHNPGLRYPAQQNPGPRNVPQQNPLQGPQSINSRIQMSGGVQNVNLVNKPNTSIRAVPQAAGLAQNGGKLSQMLLKQQDQGVLGRPSGPSKMQNDHRPYQGFGQGQQPVNFQVVPGQSGRGQHQLRRPQTLLPVAQGLYRANQNLQGLAAEHLPPQNQQRLALPGFPSQQNGQGQSMQGTIPRQQALANKLQAAQADFQQLAPRQPLGPQKVERPPVMVQKSPSVNAIQGNGNSVADTGRDQKPELPVLARDTGHPAHNDDDNNASQEGQDAILLDSFVGRRGKPQDTLGDTDNHYNDDDDNKER